jgi:hypothetical protein
MKFKPLFLFLLASCSGCIQIGTPLFVEPVEGDTTYYQPDSLKIIWKIKKDNKFYTFSRHRNLISIDEIKPDHQQTYEDLNYKERVKTVYKVDGLCTEYYDDTAHTIAAIGDYVNNEKGENWKYYDRKGRLYQLSYHMPLWIRNDFYDTTTGKVIREMDIVKSDGKTVVERDVQYVNGKEYVESNDTFISKLLQRYLVGFFITLGILCVLRTWINSIIYSREEEGLTSGFDYLFKMYNQWDNTSTDSLFFSYMPNGIKAFFTFWFSHYKPENRKLVLVANTLSIILILLFLISIISSWK